jgi:hypothetical protein
LEPCQFHETILRSERGERSLWSVVEPLDKKVEDLTVHIYYLEGWKSFVVLRISNLESRGGG